MFRLCSAVAEIADHPISYEYMLRKTSYVRADLINVTTLAPSHYELYMPSGGTNADPVIENAGEMGSPLYIDLNAICNQPGTKYFRNKFFQSLAQEGYPYLSAFPFTDDHAQGYGVFTIFDSRPETQVAPLAEKLTQIGYDFHQAIKAKGLFSAYFKLAEKELRTLEAVAIGKTMDDIAQAQGLSRRTVELRLENVRKKLQSRNSTEAVYKAISYGLINPD